MKIGCKLKVLIALIAHSLHYTYMYIYLFVLANGY